MEQVELWLKSSESEIRMNLTLCKTGTPDTFKVRYDANRIGLLVLMLETDADLCDVAYSAMLKYFADMSDQEREASLGSSPRSAGRSTGTWRRNCPRAGEVKLTGTNSTIEPWP